MQRLVDGIHHFQKNIFRSQEDFFGQLQHGQAPETLFITCSDSRINPNLITQTLPGELFILRNAGNLVPPYEAHWGGEAATIEFAVASLHVKDIIICGHSNCGAMAALLDPESLAELPATGHWLAHADKTRRIIDDNYSHLEGRQRLTATVGENVLVQLENLRTHPAVADAMAQERLHIHGWVYRFETGDVLAYDPKRGQFISVTEGEPRPESATHSNSELSI